MKWIDGLRTWRRERKIKTPSGVFKDMILEELHEYSVAKHSNNTDGIIDAIADLMVLAVNEAELEGYNIDLVMKQVVKHISSRNQDQEQASRDWSDEKWKKQADQNPDTIYQPDYTLCRLAKNS